MYVGMLCVPICNLRVCFRKSRPEAPFSHYYYQARAHARKNADTTLTDTERYTSTRVETRAQIRNTKTHIRTRTCTYRIRINADYEKFNGGNVVIFRRRLENNYVCKKSRGVIGITGIFGSADAT